MDINFSNLKTISKVAVFLVSDKKKLSPVLKKLDDESKGLISKAIAENKFEGKRNSFTSVIFPGNQFSKIILAGTGEASTKPAEKAMRELGAEIQSMLSTHKVKDASIVIEENLYGNAPAVAAANIAYGAKLKSFSFLKYFTKKKEEEKPQLKKLTINLGAEKEAVKRFEKLDAIAEGVFLARTVVSEPPNVLYPETYAEIIKNELKPLGVKVTILDEAAMYKLGMGSLLCVGQGSRKESRMVIMEYNNSANKKAAPVAFIGKGVTFDSGGISIKPADGMHDMKYDMGGSAAVVGAMKALAGRKAKVNVVGLVGLVENMPDGNAVKPADVVTSMSGQTIEVLNTDAEGRLVLADVLWYAQKNFNPKFMVDLATLTGACVVALGVHRAGLMSNDDTLAKQLFEAGEEVGERVWRLPLGDEYNKQIDSKIADVQNISNMKGGGTITAAHFLQRFVNDKKWAHLDIAGTAWASPAKALCQEGATGFGVQLLERLVTKHYED